LPEKAAGFLFDAQPVKILLTGSSVSATFNDSLIITRKNGHEKPSSLLSAFGANLFNSFSAILSMGKETGKKHGLCFGGQRE
jgi:hypothetical protein